MTKSGSTAANASQHIDQQIAQLTDWRGKTMVRLRKAILSAAPRLTEDWKWGTAVYVSQGNVAALSAFKDHVKINFFQGAALGDPHSLFNAGLDAKAMRSIDLFEGDKIDERALKELIRAAIAHNTGGKPAKPAPKPQLSARGESDRQKFQSYLDNIKAKTGLSADDFVKLAKKKGLTKASEVVAWLKADYGLGYGHSGAIWQLIGHAGEVKASESDKIAKLFAGSKSAMRPPYDALEAKVKKFGTDVEIAPNLTYINLIRGTKKFGMVQVSGERLDIGIKLKGVEPTDRFEAAGKWNAMMTHRVRISAAKQIDKDIVAWLKRAYEAAS